MKKYKLKLDYTADELKELRELSKDYKSPMNAVREIADIDNGSYKVKGLQIKYANLACEDEFDFMADINNVVMGTAIFPEKKYIVHDSATDQYIYYNVVELRLRWGRIEAVMPYKKTKDEWLEINPAYEAMLEKVEDDE